jgi:hypothetical protein
MSGETVTPLNPPMSVKRPWGWELCIAWIHTGLENEPQWKCINFETGRVVDIPQKQIRGGWNFSADRTSPELPPPMPDLAKRGPPASAAAKQEKAAQSPTLRVKVPSPPATPRRSSRDRMGISGTTVQTS